MVTGTHQRKNTYSEEWKKNKTSGLIKKKIWFSFCFSAPLTAFPSTKKYYLCVTQQRSAQTVLWILKHLSLKGTTQTIYAKRASQKICKPALLNKLVKGNQVQHRRWGKYLVCVWFSTLEAGYRSLPNHKRRDVIQRKHAYLCIKK